MCTWLKKTFIILSAATFLLISDHCYSQDSSQVHPSYKLVTAGVQYSTSEKHQKRWGEHYRKEWSTPVQVKVVMLDTLAGGVKPYEEGGGRQSRTLRLRNNKGKEFVLRSIDKTFGKALPEIAHGTFIEQIANDQVSIGHPYAAVTLPPMMQAAGIYHTRPEIIFIPKQPGLGKYNDDYGDMLYLFEQRPDENWEEAENFGNSRNIIGTEKLQEKLLGDNENRVDQLAYIRARLFDFIVGDWGRHEDQWRWASFKKEGETKYQPIPRDRDQVYTKFDGSMVTILFSIAGIDHLEGFDHTIRDITTYNFPARNLDRLMANEPTKDQWINTAKDLQQRLTDPVIENAIKQMPPEIFPISGPEIIGKIKSRRDHLVEYAIKYYEFLAINVDVPGSEERELFDITRNSDGSTGVKIFRIRKSGNIESNPFYSRVFYPGETNEIRLYGQGGNDLFRVHGNSPGGSLLRLIPGAGIDSVIDQSVVAGNRKMTRIYDDERSAFELSGEARTKISDDPFLNNYQYKAFEYDKKGFVFRPGLTLGVGYQVQKQKWRKRPYGTEHRIMGYYGPNRGSVAFEYTFTSYQMIGNWDLDAFLRMDMPYVANYFGTGNESVMLTDINRKYYRYRATALGAGFIIHRLIDSTHYLGLKTSFQTIAIRQDEDRFITKVPSEIPPEAMDRKYFAGAEAQYQFTRRDHPVVPSRGFLFQLSGAYTKNLNEENRGFANYQSSAAFYLPMLNVLSLAVRVGGEAVTGQPEFYQLATLSGKENLRGYRRQRFHGETSFYNNNELRLIMNTRNRWFNGKFGALVFVDQGRVWQPGERSDKWHVGYGGGIFVAPFNKILLNASYGISKDDKVIHMRLGFFF